MHSSKRHDSEVIVLRLHCECPDDEVCPAVLDAGDPEYLHLVVTDEDRPDVLARLASRVGPGERLVRWPRRAGMPEVSPSC